MAPVLGRAGAQSRTEGLCSVRGTATGTKGDEEMVKVTDEQLDKIMATDEVLRRHNSWAYPLSAPELTSILAEVKASRLRIAALERLRVKASRERDEAVEALQQIQQGAMGNSGRCMDCDSIATIATRTLLQLAD